MQVTQVTSANIKAHAWDGNNLYVQFVKTGAVYEYPDCSEGDYDAFRQAESLGQHFHAHIKKAFVARLVSQDELIMDDFREPLSVG